MLPENNLAKLATPLNLVGLLIAYFSYKVSPTLCKQLASETFESESSSLSAPAYLCFLLVSAQKCPRSSFR
jgi:hypothetical protein